MTPDPRLDQPGRPVPKTRNGTTWDHGRAGGRACALKLTPEQRRAIAQTAARARWRPGQPGMPESAPPTPPDRRDERVRYWQAELHGWNAGALEMLRVVRALLERMVVLETERDAARAEVVRLTQAKDVDRP